MLVLHSKLVLHRDLKTQNIFIKKGVLKLGDFGISRSLEDFDAMAQTQVGTPYYLAPEVCRGEKYSFKADIWALGVIIYELITLRKPFDCNSKQQDVAASFSKLFDMIKNDDIEPLPEGTSTDLRLLISATLNKDKDSRPDIFTLVRLPSIKKRIIEFIEEYNCKEEVMRFLEF